MRWVLTAVMGFALVGGLSAYGVGLAKAHGLMSLPIGDVTEGGVASAITLAGQGLVVPPTREYIEQMCVFLLGCPDVPLAVPSGDLGECVRILWKELSSPQAIQFSLPLRECGLQASSCDELRRCALRGVSQTVCQGRGTQGPIGFCDAEGRAIVCSKGKLMQVRDCPRVNEQCAMREGVAACVLGACPKEASADGASVCSANEHKVLHCEKGKLLSLDCSAFGLRCINGIEGKPLCAPSTNTAACTGDTDRCEGGDHISCIGGHEVRVQCSKAGMSCSNPNTSSSVGWCALPSDDGNSKSCDATMLSRCVKQSVQFCAAGRVRSFSCKTLGFPRCIGAMGQAHCAL